MQDYNSRISIPTHIFVYNLTNRRDEFSYALNAIKKTNYNFVLNTQFLQKQHLTFRDLEDIKWYLHLYCAELNRCKILFLFQTREGYIVCRPSSMGSPSGGSMEILHNSTWIRDIQETSWETLSTSEPSISIDTFLFHYNEFRHQEFIFRGISSFPATSISVPHWFSSNTLRSFLQNWNGVKISLAQKAGLVTTSNLDGTASIYKLYVTINPKKQNPEITAKKTKQ
jgi:hypothetical protein